MMVLKKTSRHPAPSGLRQGIKAPRKYPVVGVCRPRIVRSSSTRPSGLLGGFSLMEVLMSIFILAIGIISISALFPAGIAQQRHAVDDMMGPIVANNAMTILRSKLRPEDFGADEDFNLFSSAQLRTLHGDWEWRRPVFFTQEVDIPTPFGPSTITPGTQKQYTLLSQLVQLFFVVFLLLVRLGIILYLAINLACLLEFKIIFFIQSTKLPN